MVRECRHRIGFDETGLISVHHVVGGVDDRGVGLVVLAEIHAVERPVAFAAGRAAANDGVGGSHVDESQTVVNGQAFADFPVVLGISVEFPEAEPWENGAAEVGVAREVAQHQVGQSVAGVLWP